MEVIDTWRGILANESLTYSDIITHPFYDRLEDVISPRVASLLRQEATKTDREISRLKLELQAHGEYACNLGLDVLYEDAADEEKSDRPPYEDPVFALKEDTTNEFLTQLRRELLRLERKWGLL